MPPELSAACTENGLGQLGLRHDMGFIAHLKPESKWVFENSLSFREVCLCLIIWLYLWILCQMQGRLCRVTDLEMGCFSINIKIPRLFHYLIPLGM